LRASVRVGHAPVHPASDRSVAPTARPRRAKRRMRWPFPAALVVVQAPTVVLVPHVQPETTPGPSSRPADRRVPGKIPLKEPPADPPSSAARAVQLSGSSIRSRNPGSSSMNRARGESLAGAPRRFRIPGTLCETCNVHFLVGAPGGAGGQKAMSSDRASSSARSRPCAARIPVAVVRQPPGIVGRPAPGPAGRSAGSSDEGRAHLQSPQCRIVAVLATTPGLAGLGRPESSRALVGRPAVVRPRRAGSHCTMPASPDRPHVERTRAP